MTYKRILIATDGSALSKKAVISGIDLAAVLGAAVVMLKVVPRYPQAYFEGAVMIDSQEIKQVEKRWADDAQAVVDSVCESAEAKGVKAKGLTVKSDLVAEAVIAAAKKNKSDLIVMASHGRKGIKRLLLGSETQNVLTNSHIPVLVLR
ncbi:MAG TPA: universal stress protein [Burkholderiaceae bacterium]